VLIELKSTSAGKLFLSFLTYFLCHAILSLIVTYYPKFKEVT